MIEANGVHRRQGGLRDITLTIPAGACTAILGPNGAGKSTLLDVLAGRVSIDSGVIRFGGRPLLEWPARELAQWRAFLPQSNEVAFPIRVYDLVALGRSPYRRTRDIRYDPAAIESALLRADAWHLRDRIYQRISGGERQRVQLARAIAQIWRPPGKDREPRMLLLDEPTASLDPGHRLAVMRLLRDLTSADIGVVIALHDLNDALRFADCAVLLDRGRIKRQGTPERALDIEVLTATYGAKAGLIDVGVGRPVVLFE